MITGIQTVCSYVSMFVCVPCIVGAALHLQQTRLVQCTSVQVDDVTISGRSVSKSLVMLQHTHRVNFVQNCSSIKFSIKQEASKKEVMSSFTPWWLSSWIWRCPSRCRATTEWASSVHLPQPSLDPVWLDPQWNSWCEHRCLERCTVHIKKK